MRKSERFANLKTEIEEAATIKIENKIRAYTTYYDQEVDKYKSDLNAKIKAHLANEEKNIAKEMIKLKAAQKFEIRKAIIDHRQKWIDKLFVDLENKVVDFTKSKDYKKWLEAKVDLVYSDDFNGGTIQANSHDLSLLKELVASKNLVTVEKELIGGFILINKEHNQAINCSLKGLISEQRNYFLETYKLFVPEEEEGGK